MFGTPDSAAALAATIQQATTAQRRRLCRDCADYDGTCPNDGLPCKRESADPVVTRIEFAPGHEDAPLTSEQVAALMRKVRLAPRMLAALKEADRLYSTYGLQASAAACGPWINAVRDLIAEAEGRA